MDLLDTAAKFAPGANAPTSAQAPAAAAPTARSGGGLLDRAMGFARGPGASLVPPPPGADPLTAIPESPLGIMERAHLGWEKTPAAQKDMLDQRFGADNVRMVGGNFVAKDNDGKWKQVDPDFQWSVDPKAQAAGDAIGGLTGRAVTNFMDDVGKYKQLAGSAAQFMGKYGLKAAAATEGGITGAELGTPGGPIGMAVGAIAGAGYGAMEEDAAETAGRYALSKMGASNPKSLPQNPEETVKQLYGSFIFGAAQEAGGRALSGLGSMTANGLARAVKTMGATPEGKELAGKMLGVLSGEGEAVGRIRANDPMAMVPYDQMQIADNRNGTSMLVDKMKGKISDFVDMALQAKRRLGSQYDAVDAAASKLDYNPTGAVSDLRKALEQNEFTSNGQLVANAGALDIPQKLSSADRGMLKYVLRAADRIEGSAAGSGSVSYGEMKNLLNALDSGLYGNSGVSNQNLARILKGFRAGVDNHLTQVLEASAPEMAALKGQLDAKWGPVKDMLDDMARSTDDGKIDAFTRKIIKNDGSYNSGLIKNVSDVLGMDNPTTDIMRMHAARSTSTLWGGGTIGAIPVGTPRGAAMVATNFSQTKGAIKQALSASTGSIPYADSLIQTIKGMAPATRKLFYSNPQAMKMSLQMLGDASSTEQSVRGSLLQSAGIAPTGAGAAQ